MLFHIASFILWRTSKYTFKDCVGMIFSRAVFLHTVSNLDGFCWVDFLCDTKRMSECRQLHVHVIIFTMQNLHTQRHCVPSYLLGSLSDSAAALVWVPAWTAQSLRYSKSVLSCLSSPWHQMLSWIFMDTGGCAWKTSAVSGNSNPTDLTLPLLCW